MRVELGEAINLSNDVVDDLVPELRRWNGVDTCIHAFCSVYACMHVLATVDVDVRSSDRAQALSLSTASRAEASVDCN
jgi:hypothetical protein